MSSLYDAGRYDSAAYDGVSVGNPVVELFINGAWTNVTAYVRVADGIQIRRGRQDWSSAPTFATCDLTLDNRDGRFTPRNTTGAYYPYLVRNTPLRVSVYDDSGVARVRFWGDVAEWPVDVIGFGADLVTRVQAAGLRRRLARSGVLQSPYRIAAGGLGSLVAYWPMEVGTGATGYGSAVTSNTKALTLTGTVNGGASSDFSNTSSDLPTLAGDQSSVQGFVPAYTLSAAGQEVRMLLECDTSTAGQGVDIVVAFTSGDYIVAEYVPVANTIELSYITAAGTTPAHVGPGTAGAQPISAPCRVSIESVQNGTGVDFQIVWYNIATLSSSGVVLSYGLTAAATTLAPVKSVTVKNGGTDVTTVVGHITVQNTKTTMFDLTDVTLGYAGEHAKDRAIRLGAAQGASPVIVPAVGSVFSETMGVQTQDTFLNLFDETASVDGGISTEDVTTRALSWRPRSSLYSQNVALQVGLTKLDGLQSTDDDQTIENDVTVTRVNGGTANYMVTSGNLSVATIGDYATSYDLNVYTDDQLPYQAQWRAAVGTVDEPRRSSVSFDAMRLTSLVRTSLIALREGDRMLVTSVTDNLAPTSPTGIDTLVLGWTETITDTAWHFDVNTRPSAPYSTVFVLDDAIWGILDTDRLGL